VGTIRERNGKIRAEVRRRGLYESQEFTTRTAAKAWITRLEADYLARRRGDLPKKSLREAIERYRDEVAPKMRGERWETIRLNKLAKDLGETADKQLSMIQAPDILEWRDKRLQDVAEASVAREWNVLRGVFTVALRDWKWIREHPMRELKRPGRGKPRDRLVQAGELDALYRVSGYQQGKPHLQKHRAVLAFDLAIETGMRAGEIRTLDPGDVDLELGVASLSKTKNGDDRKVPLNKRARELIQLLIVPGESQLLPMSANTLDTTFRRLVKKAGIKGLHFHDSRAEACTRFAKSGKVDVLTLARIIGHRDINSLRIYYRETAADIAARLD